MRRALPAVTGVFVVAAVGCGGDQDYANEQRPPSPIVVTASISNNRVSVSPERFGAGPISVIVTNQTGAAQQVTLESADTSAAAGLRQQTAPINPRDTATLKADVQPGRYTLGVGGDGIAPATIRVGRERASAQNDLLQP